MTMLSPRHCSAQRSIGRSSRSRGSPTWTPPGTGRRYVTPAQRHAGQDGPVLAARHAVYQDARQRNPQRWSGSTATGNRLAPSLSIRSETSSSGRQLTNPAFRFDRQICFPVPTWQRPSRGAQRRRREEQSHPEPRAERPGARAWRGWRAPDLLRSEHRGTLITSPRFASPDIYAASTAASSVGGIITKFRRQLC